MTDGVNHLVRNRHLVEDLGGALRSGQHGLAVVPGLLKRLLHEESWREFVTQRGEHVEHERFDDFVEQQPLRGLGATMELIERIVETDPEAVVLLREARKRKAGRPARASDSGNNMTRIADRPERGTSRAYALDRLRRSAPELHAAVLAGNLSAHAAMVKAGFTPKRFTVQVRSADSVAETLKKCLPPELLAEVVARLSK